MYWGDNMKNKTCCFTGHRKIDNTEFPTIKKHLEQEVKSLIEQGVIYFGCGGALGFDTLAAQTVLKFKERYSQVKLILVLPCKDQTYGWHTEDIAVYENIKNKADKVRVLCEHYYKGCMQARNRHLVDNSGICVFYLRQATSGTAYTVDYAQKHDLKIIRI